MRHRLSIILCLIASAAALIGCRQESLEKEGFQLYYSGVTNIGPNMTVNLTAHHFGGEPEEFAITEVKFGSDAYEGPEFTINPENGTVTVAGVRETQAGDYTVSVSCKVSGTVLSYPGIIEVTFFKGVPDEIKVSPDTLILDLYTLKKDSQANDTTATITTDGDHIAVTGYRIANVRFADEVIDNIASPHFKVSEDGIITVLKNDSFKIGTYSIDLKLSTSSFGSESEVGLFTDALTVKVVSVPVSFSYSPDSGLLEEEDGVATSFTSAVPVMNGSQEDVQWSIAGCTPENEKLLIDPQTGVLSIKEGHGLRKGVTYVVDVNVKNRYSTDDGLTIKGAYSIELVGYIAPIKHFGYEAAGKKMGTGWSVIPDAETDGGNIRHYEWTNAEATYTKVLVLNPKTGEISAVKGNDLPVGKHEISVTAANGKTGGEVVAVFSLEITENPYYFTYFSYGNNLGLTEEQTKGVSQFRVKNKTELAALTVNPTISDIASGTVITWKLDNFNKINSNNPKIHSGNTSIDENTGQLTFTESTWIEAGLAVGFITATSEDPDDPDNSFSVTTPIFIDCSSPVDGVTIEYNPFVLRVNPKTGGRSGRPVISGVEGDIFLDYRRDFFYYNIHGADSEGNAFKSGQVNPKAQNYDAECCPFLEQLWKQYGLSNFGGKDPMSFYKNETDVSKTLAYIDGNDGHALVVNPDKWFAEGFGWGDGVVHGQITFSTSKDGVNNGSKIHPIAIWLDKDFEE